MPEDGPDRFQTVPAHLPAHVHCREFTTVPPPEASREVLLITHGLNSGRNPTLVWLSRPCLIAVRTALLYAEGQDIGEKERKKTVRLFSLVGGFLPSPLGWFIHILAGAAIYAKPKQARNLDGFCLYQEEHCGDV